jgi:hypothetical protein
MCACFSLLCCIALNTCRLLRAGLLNAHSSRHTNNTNVCMHASAHTHTHTCIHTYTCTLKLTHKQHECVHACKCTRMHARSHTHLQADTQAPQMCACMQTHIHTHAHTHHYLHQLFNIIFINFNSKIISPRFQDCRLHYTHVHTHTLRRRPWPFGRADFVMVRGVGQHGMLVQPFRTILLPLLVRKDTSQRSLRIGV